MALLFLRDISLSYGSAPLLDNIQLQIQPRERLCILGRNGEGKSTLLKIIEGSLQPDKGQRIIQDGIKIAKLQQEVPQDLKGSVYHIIATGLGNLGKLLTNYHSLRQQIDSASHQNSNPNEQLTQLTHCQQQIDDLDAWQLDAQIASLTSKLGLSTETEFSTLSGGMKRRVLLAKALIQDPDILLLDEPTNHLDIPSIQWLEQFLKTLNCTLVFITHDRAFLQALATRIVELDRGQLHNWQCDYATYLQRKAAQLAAQAKQNANFDKKLAQEEAWIRQGIKARRTRNEGRVRALEKLRAERQARRNQQGTAKMQLNTAEQSGKKVIEVKNISFAWPNTDPLIQNFSTLITRGDKVAIIGPNGCGKSTLLQLLLGQIPPTQGQITIGTQLKVAYFDQHRSQLDLEKTVAESVIDGSDTVEINGQRKHIIGYLSDFLFHPNRARQPVKALSGGERNRLLLARTFAQPSNLLVLDEPTNDLDLETLELLEELVANYPGTVLLVSHDRAFINHVVTNSLVFDAPGKLNEYVGGYDDWLRQRPQHYAEQGYFQTIEPPTTQKNPKTISKTNTKISPPAKQKPQKPARKPKKLSYKEQKLYDSLPDKIEQLEAELEQLAQQTQATTFYQQPQDQIQAVLAELQAKETELETAFEQWETLEAKKQTLINT